MLKLLQVRSTEWWLVRHLFWIQFFQGTGLAFYFTAAFSMLLKIFSIAELPSVMVFSSFLLWLTGAIYNKLEHKFPILKLSMGIVVMMGSSMIVYWLLLRNGVDHPLFFDWIFAWFNVLYLLNNLEFWGIASLLFDVRQSKRLFSVISSGDIPAKLIGYTIAYLFVKQIGELNLFLIGGICMLISLPLLYGLKSHLAEHQLQDEAHETHKDHHSERFRIKPWIKQFVDDRLTVKLALLSLIVFMSFLMVNFAFYSEVKSSKFQEGAIAKFIAGFLVIVRFCALIFKLLITGRIINELGVLRSLLITPILFGGMIGLVILSFWLSPGSQFYLYLFGVAYIIMEVLRMSINSPVFLTIMQPLPRHDRLRAHHIVKGVMDPFAFLFSGLLLIAMLQLMGGVDLEILSWILLGLVAVWIALVFSINSSYFHTLLKTISTRTLQGDDIQLGDKASQVRIAEKLKSGTELEQIYLLRMLRNQPYEGIDEILLHYFPHCRGRAHEELLHLVRERNLVAAIPALQEWLRDESLDTTVRAHALLTLNTLRFDETLNLQYLEHADEHLQSTAVAGLLRYGGETARLRAERNLETLAASDYAPARARAARFMAEFTQRQDHPLLIKLLDDDQPEVVTEAIFTAGKTGGLESIARALAHMQGHEKAVILALEEAGNLAIPLVLDKINETDTPFLHQKKLIQLLGRNRDRNAGDALIQLLRRSPLLSQWVIKALYRSGYRPAEEDQPLIEQWISRYLLLGTDLLHMQNTLVKQQDKYEILANSLQVELEELRELMLKLMGMIYDRGQMETIQRSFEMGKHGLHANALEMLEISVNKKFAKPFCLLYEHGKLEDRCRELKSHRQDLLEGLDYLLQDILRSSEPVYDHWTRSCSLYLAHKHKHPLEKSLIERYTRAEHPLLKETAEYALLN